VSVVPKARRTHLTLLLSNRLVKAVVFVTAMLCLRLINWTEKHYP
jgi:hypothetical protein